MNIFSELYAKHLGRTLFFISIGISSAIGQHLLTKNILHDDYIATVVAVMWAALLVVIYSYFVAEREFEYNQMANSFNYHRTLKGNNPINAIAKNYEDITPVPEQVKPNFSKIEIVHSMEKSMDSSKENKA